MNAEQRCPVSRDFDPFGPAFQSDPGGSLRASRAEQPVFFSELLHVYVVTRHADVRAVLTNAAAFSSRAALEPIEPLRPPAVAKLAEHGWQPLPTLLVADEPAHMRRRRRVQEPFSQERIDGWEQRVREIFDGYIDGFVKRGRADLVAEMFSEGPAIVALEFMGVPRDDMEEAKLYAQGLVQFLFGHPDEQEQVAICDVIGRSHAYGKGLVSRILEGDAEGDGLLQYAVREHRRDPTDLERAHLDGLATSMLAAAHETTTNALGNALRLLLEHPTSWEALCEDPALIPGAVEECLRMGLPMAVTFRACVQDTEVGGVTIPAGAKVMLALASANDDEALFERPADFDIGRVNARRHLTFGTGGHACLGARLARLEMQVVLEQLARRLPHMRLVADQRCEYRGTAAVGGPLSLRVEWDAEENPRSDDRP